MLRGRGLNHRCSCGHSPFVAISALGDLQRGTMAFCLKAGEVAGRASIDVQTLRYYERLQLLDAPERSAGNHRLYSRETVQRVLFIKRAQTLGLSLADVRGILQAEREGSRRCDTVARLLRIQLDLIRESLRDLERRRGLVEQAIESWDRERVSEHGAPCRGSFCHLIEQCAEPAASARPLSRPRKH
jgi:DNA-binding transcriptional MerR regulator